MNSNPVLSDIQYGSNSTRPDSLKVTFYEIGFCTSDPLASGTFVDTTCSKTWDNASGFESDLGQQSYEDMIGTTYRIPNATYTHAYGIMNNSWSYKGQYKLTHSGGTTYYTNSTNGLVTTNSSEYGEWNDDISDMQGEETTGLCYDYSASTVGGDVTAVLANSSLQTATDSTSCNNATRVIGSVALTSSLTMDDTVKGYQLNWRISNMGIGISDNGNANNIPYLECPVMGGPVQAEEGILGGIVGGSEENLKRSEELLKCFCKNYYHFGGIGNGAKTKLLNNFLSLGTATYVIELIKAAKKLDIDLDKLYKVAQLGSGNSNALKRIFDKVLEDDYTGFKFTATNTLKDLTYITDLLKGMDNAEKLSDLSKSFYKKAVDEGDGELFISELIKKN